MKTILLPILAVLLPLVLPAQVPPPGSEEEALVMVKQIYTDVSKEDDTPVDWEKVRAIFDEEAVIVLQTSREESTRFTVDGFLQDFKDFYKNPAVSESGFKEEVLRLESSFYREMAFVAVVYEARILNSERPPTVGIDFWLLSLKDRNWKVIAVTNQVIPPGEEIPDLFE